MRFFQKIYTIFVILVIFVIVFQIMSPSSVKNDVNIKIEENNQTGPFLINQINKEIQRNQKRIDSNVLCIIMTTEQTLLNRSLIG
jgi:Na+/H+ antiporter NhaC